MAGIRPTVASSEHFRREPHGQQSDVRGQAPIQPPPPTHHWQVWRGPPGGGGGASQGRVPAAALVEEEEPGLDGVARGEGEGRGGPRQGLGGERRGAGFQPTPRPAQWGFPTQSWGEPAPTLPTTHWLSGQGGGMGEFQPKTKENEPPRLQEPTAFASRWTQCELLCFLEIGRREGGPDPPAKMERGSEN